MLKRASVWGLVVAGALIVGCDDETNKPAPAPAPAPAPSGTTGGGGTDMTPATQPTGAAAGATDAIVAEAKTKLQQVTEFIQARKFSDAEPLLKQLEGMKDKLPQAIQDQIVNVRKMFDTAKQGAAAIPGGIPGVGGQ